MLIKGYTEITFARPGPQHRAIHWAAHFKLDTDISVIFPYINSIVEDSIYYEKPHYVFFTYDGHDCILHPDEIVLGFFDQREEAIGLVKKLIIFLNDTYSRRESIKPVFKMKRHIPVLDIYKLLPGTNCGECGYSACMAFAATVSKGNSNPQKCPALGNPIAENAVYPVYDENGTLISTIAIDIDSQKRKHEFDKKLEQARNLESKISGILQNKSNIDTDVSKYGLTKREIDVLRLMAEGLTNNEISCLLSISPHTVKSHVLHIFNKIGVNDRTQASVWAARSNLI